MLLGYALASFHNLIVFAAYSYPAVHINCGGKVDSPSKREIAFVQNQLQNEVRTHRPANQGVGLADLA